MDPTTPGTINVVDLLVQSGIVGLVVFALIAFARGWVLWGADHKRRIEAVEAERDRAIKALEAERDRYIVEGDKWREAYMTETKAKGISMEQISELLETSRTMRAFINSLAQAVPQS